MQSPQSFAEILLRAVDLLGLATVPAAFSPDPHLPEARALPVVFAGVLLAALAFGAARFRKAAGSQLASASAILAWLSLAAAVGGAIVFSGDRAPLARGVPFVAPLVWAALITGAAAAADKWLAPWADRRLIAGAVTFLIGAAIFSFATPWLKSPDAMWRRTLARDGNHPHALEALTAPMLAGRRYDDANKVVDECLEGRPDACPCLDLRAEIALTQHAYLPAVTAARAAVAACPERQTSHALLAEALAFAGDPAAEQEARRGLAEGGPALRLRYALAIALSRKGLNDEAIAELQKTVDEGGGHDPKLLAGALCIAKGDLKGAEDWLLPLEKANPNDAPTLYDLGLIADKRGDFNGARQRYLATLKADPRYADARYNLALLTWRVGVVGESKHHLERFVDAFPNDPRIPELRRTINGAPPAPLPALQTAPTQGK